MTRPQLRPPVVLLVCGGRDFTDLKFVHGRLDDFAKTHTITLLIHGDAPGVDSLAGAWAAKNNVPVKAVAAQWAVHGRSAGFIRNRQMMEHHPTYGIAFPGGAGTEDMIGVLRQCSVPVLVLRRDSVTRCQRGAHAHSS